MPALSAKATIGHVLQPSGVGLLGDPSRSIHLAVRGVRSSTSVSITAGWTLAFE